VFHPILAVLMLASGAKAGPVCPTEAATRQALGVDGAWQVACHVTKDEPKEVLLWAAHYAASTQHRGLERVGLGSAGSWANLTWAAAVRKMRLLGEAARLASMPPGEDLYRSLDPRAVSPRRAALGHDG